MLGGPQGRSGRSREEENTFLLRGFEPYNFQPVTWTPYLLSYPGYSYLIKSHFNPLNAQSNPICHLLALLGDHHILHVSR
jgi:hypothetical protein